VLKYTSKLNRLNNTLEWIEEVFLDIENNDMAKDTKIVSLNLNKVSDTKHVLIVNISFYWLGFRIYMMVIL
jgi:hypothetical protein